MPCRQRRPQVARAQTPEKTQDGIQRAYVLVVCCVQAWLDDPGGRPTANDVMERIKAMELPLDPDETAARPAVKPATPDDTCQNAEPTSEKARALLRSVSL